MSKSRAAALLFVVIDVFGIAIANAQGTLTSEDRQAILAFTFTPQKANAIIAAMSEMTKYLDEDDAYRADGADGTRSAGDGDRDATRPHGTGVQLRRPSVADGADGVDGLRR